MTHDFTKYESLKLAGLPERINDFIKIFIESLRYAGNSDNLNRYHLSVLVEEHTELKHFASAKW